MGLIRIEYVLFPFSLIFSTFVPVLKRLAPGHKDTIKYFTILGEIPILQLTSCKNIIAAQTQIDYPSFLPLLLVGIKIMTRIRTRPDYYIPCTPPFFFFRGSPSAPSSARGSALLPGWHLNPRKSRLPSLSRGLRSPLDLARESSYWLRGRGRGPSALCGPLRLPGRGREPAVSQEEWTGQLSQSHHHFQWKMDHSSMCHCNLFGKMFWKTFDKGTFS